MRFIKGSKHTEDARKKMSLSARSRKRRPLSEETKRKIGLANSVSNKGKVPSAETRAKLSASMKGKSTRWLTGRKLPQEVKDKIRETHKKIGAPWMKGKRLSEETKKKIGDAERGPKHYNWKGGYENKLMLSRKRRALKTSSIGFHSLGDWEFLKAQYNWTCPACKRSEPGIKLTEDHIIPLTKGGSDNIENIQPLCKSCNSRKQTRVIKYPVFSPATDLSPSESRPSEPLSLEIKELKVKVGDKEMIFVPKQ